MFHKRKKFLAALALLALGAGAANASVTINGNTLDKINDIVVETTGSRVVTQESLLKVMKASDGKLRFYPTRGNVDGNNVNLSEAGAQHLNVDGGKTNTGVHPAVGTKRNGDGSLVMMVPSATESGVTANFYKVNIDANSNIKQELIVSKNVVSGKNFYITDAAGGLFPNGKDGDEVFVIAYFSADGNQRPGFKQSFTSYVAFVDAKGSVQTQRVGTMNGCFPSIRVAVGDFDNDGNNELAVMRDGSGHDYYMQAFRVNSSLGWEAFYSKSLGTRDDDADNIDGCDIVVGDFNGDGQTDLAAEVERRRAAMRHGDGKEVTEAEIAALRIVDNPKIYTNPRTDNQQYRGRIVHVDEERGFYVQLVGRQSLFVHGLERLDVLPGLGEDVKIAYNLGEDKAIVQCQEVRRRVRNL